MRLCVKQGKGRESHGHVHHSTQTHNRDGTILTPFSPEMRFWGFGQVSNSFLFLAYSSGHNAHFTTQLDFKCKDYRAYNNNSLYFIKYFFCAAINEDCNNNTELTNEKQNAKEEILFSQ